MKTVVTQLAYFVAPFVRLCLALPSMCVGAAGQTQGAGIGRLNESGREGLEHMWCYSTVYIKRKAKMSAFGSKTYFQRTASNVVHGPSLSQVSVCVHDGKPGV